MKKIILLVLVLTVMPAASGPAFGAEEQTIEDRVKEKMGDKAAEDGNYLTAAEEKEINEFSL